MNYQKPSKNVSSRWYGNQVKCSSLGMKSSPPDIPEHSIWPVACSSTTWAKEKFGNRKRLLGSQWPKINWKPMMSWSQCVAGSARPFCLGDFTTASVLNMQVHSAGCIFPHNSHQSCWEHINPDLRLLLRIVVFSLCTQSFCFYQNKEAYCTEIKISVFSCGCSPASKDQISRPLDGIVLGCWVWKIVATDSGKFHEQPLNKSFDLEFGQLLERRK